LRRSFRRVEHPATDAPDVQVVLVLDNTGWHVSKQLKVPDNVTLMPLPPYANCRTRVRRSPHTDNVTLLPLPPYSPELNPVERVWAFLRSRYLSNRVFKNYDTLFDKATVAWNRLDPSRLAWITQTQWTPRAG